MFLHPSPVAHALNISIFAHLQQQKWLCVYVRIPWDVLLSAIFILKEKSLGCVVICMKPAIKHTILFFPAFLTFRQKHLSCTGLVMQAAVPRLSCTLFLAIDSRISKTLGRIVLTDCTAAAKRLKLLLSVVKLRYLVCRSNKLRHGRGLKLATAAKCGTVALNTKPPFNLSIPFSRQRLSLLKPYLD